jgi:glycosyltransferase involved in cell wall biosynthesis
VPALRSPAGQAPRARPIRVVHVISGLGLGGAETMLLRLVRRLDRDCFDCRVVSMTDEGFFGSQLRALGIPVATLGMRRGLPQIRGLIDLARLMRRTRPDVVHTWMYHADLLGGLAAWLAGKIPVVWGIRHTDLRPGSARTTTRVTAWLNARLSRWLAATIVCNSEASRRIHERLGYDASRMVVIPNGFELQIFRPDDQARARVRRECGLPGDAPVVGHIARFHPQKGHEVFIRAAGRLSERIPQVHFLLAGEGMTAENESLAAWIREAKIGATVHLLGKQPEPAPLYAAMDVFCLSSHGESFPQVVGEAMACGVPCVVTDVGDAAVIVGSTGLVVPPGDAAQLSAALEDLLSRPRQVRIRMGQAARARIRAKYGLERIVARYAELYTGLGGIGQRGSVNG